MISFIFQKKIQYGTWESDVNLSLLWFVTQWYNDSRSNDDGKSTKLKRNSCDTYKNEKQKTIETKISTEQYQIKLLET